MQSTPIQEPRSIFKYQKRYLYLELSLSLITMTVLMVSWIPSLYTQLAYGVIIPSAIRAALFLTTTTILFAILILIILKGIRESEIIITDERLIIKSPHKIRVILFSEIFSVKYVHLPIHHGFLKIKSLNTSMTIPLYIENMESLVQAIATGLVRYRSIDLFDKKIIEKLTISSCVHKSSYQRGQHVLLPILLTSASLFFFNILISVHFWGINLIELLFWSCTGMIVPSLMYILSDIVLSNKLRTNITNKTIDNSSQPIHLPVALIVLICYFIAGWFFKSLVL